MELIIHHLEILHFQISAGIIEIYASYLLFKEQKLFISLMLFTESLKNIFNLIVIIIPGSITEKFYCCTDMAFSFFQCIMLLTFVYNYLLEKNILEYESDEILNNLEWTGKKQSIITILTSIVINLDFLYLILIGESLVLNHDYLPLPGMLIGIGISRFVSYGLLPTKNILIINLYFISKLLSISAVSILMVFHYFITDSFILLCCDFIILLPRIIKIYHDRHKPT